MYSLGYMCSSPISSIVHGVNPARSGLFPHRLDLSPATTPPQLLRRQTLAVRRYLWSHRTLRTLGRSHRRDLYWPIRTILLHRS
ncbi:hypothetical protein AALP_AA1G216900 [Arabis alpina]|uniref:Uncharacterized protein n=1 Tax=Arabis alpina TaxID=50452 RepID=A0A087HPQ7_ARAAL|nr:hypothetical protein AALP_AA1G216900 [Arabis alpina]